MKWNAAAISLFLFLNWAPYKTNFKLLTWVLEIALFLSFSLPSSFPAMLYLLNRKAEPKLGEKVDSSGEHEAGLKRRGQIVFEQT